MVDSVALCRFPCSVVVLGPTGRCDSPKTCMSSGSIVENLDPLLDRRLSLEPGAEPTVVDPLLFQRAPETLSRGVIVTAAWGMNAPRDMDALIPDFSMRPW